MIHRLELFDFYYYCHILYINLFDFHADHDQINWSLTSLTTIILMMLIFVLDDVLIDVSMYLAGGSAHDELYMNIHTSTIVGVHINWPLTLVCAWTSHY